MQMMGTQMAVEQLNAKGGVNGKQLEAVLIDDVCEPKQAVTVANQIVNDKIKYVAVNRHDPEGRDNSEQDDNEVQRIDEMASFQPDWLHKNPRKTSLY